jgi:hypothetical protein
MRATEIVYYVSIYKVNFYKIFIWWENIALVMLSTSLFISAVVMYGRIKRSIGDSSGKARFLRNIVVSSCAFCFCLCLRVFMLVVYVLEVQRGFEGIPPFFWLFENQSFSPMNNVCESTTGEPKRQQFLWQALSTFVPIFGAITVMLMMLWRGAASDTELKPSVRGVSSKPQSEQYGDKLLTSDGISSLPSSSIFRKRNDSRSSAGKMRPSVSSLPPSDGPQGRILECGDVLKKEE